MLLGIKDNLFEDNDNSNINGIIISYRNCKSKLIIGDGDGVGLTIFVDQKFSLLQKFMWKKLFGINIVDNE